MAQSYGGSVGIKDNEVATAFYFTAPPIRRFSFQVNILPVTIIPQDRYNQNERSTSNYSLFVLGAVLTSEILLGGDDFGHGVLALPESSATRRWIALPLLLTVIGNSQLHWNWVSRDPAHPLGLVPSFFAGLQTDTYFRNTKWIRTSQCLGFQLNMVFGSVDSTGHEEPSIEAAVQVGAERYRDISSEFHPQDASRVFVAFRMGLAMGWKGEQQEETYKP